MWDKSIAHQCEIVNFDDSRLLVLLLSIGSYSLLIINVYLPYYCNDNYPSYIMYLGKIESIIDNHNANGVLILGDFSADVNGIFYNE